MYLLHRREHLPMLSVLGRNHSPGQADGKFMENHLQLGNLKTGKMICNWRFSTIIFSFTITCVSLGKIVFSMSWVKVVWWENLLSNRSNFSYHVLTHIEMETVEGIFQWISGIGSIVGQGWEPLNVVNPSLNIQIWCFFLILSKTQKLG